MFNIAIKFLQMKSLRVLINDAQMGVFLMVRSHIRKEMASLRQQILGRDIEDMADIIGPGADINTMVYIGCQKKETVGCQVIKLPLHHQSGIA